MWLFVVVIFLIFLYVYKIISPPRRIFELAEKIPGPKWYPIIGSTIVFKPEKSNLETTREFYEQFGPTFRVWSGPNDAVFVLCDPDDIEVFLSGTKFLNRPSSYRLFESWLGETSLLTLNDDNWRIHRKLLTPSFHFKIVEKAIPTILRNAEILCKKLEPENPEVSLPGFNIEKCITLCALDIIGEIAMGIKLNSQLSENSDYVDSTKNVAKLLQLRYIFPWLRNDTIFKLSKTGRDYYDSLKVLKEKAQKVIYNRKKLLQENRKISNNDNDTETEGNNQTNVNGNGEKKLKPLLDFILTETNFNNIEIESAVQTFMFGGHDTVKSAIIFCLYCLANHQDIQDKAVKEIREIMLNVNGEPSYNDFIRLKYLGNVIKESLRLYPPIPFMSRKIDEDVTLQSSGYVLPAGCEALVCIYLVHRNDKYFKEPEKFIPERFEEEDVKRNPYAYVPFSAGPRNCIGQRIAKLEIIIILAVLLLQYQFSLDANADPIIVEDRVSLKTKHAIPIKIKKRETR